MKPFALAALAFAALSLVGCSEGDDVYVTNPATASSASSLECLIEPGASVCDRPFASVGFDQRARTLDALQAVSDFAWVADSAVKDVEGACAGLAEAILGVAPLPPTNASAAERLSLVCNAARDVVRGTDQGSLHVEVLPATESSPAACGEPAPRTCSSFSPTPLAYCAPPRIVVTVSPGSSAKSFAVADALTNYYGEIGRLKTRLEALAAIAGRITANSDALSLLPRECIASSVKLTTAATASIEAVTTAAAQMNDAMTWASK